MISFKASLTLPGNLFANRTLRPLVQGDDDNVARAARNLLDGWESQAVHCTAFNLLSTAPRVASHLSVDGNGNAQFSLATSTRDGLKAIEDDTKAIAAFLNSMTPQTTVRAVLCFDGLHQVALAEGLAAYPVAAVLQHLLIVKNIMQTNPTLAGRLDASGEIQLRIGSPPQDTLLSVQYIVQYERSRGFNFSQTCLAHVATGGDAVTALFDSAQFLFDLAALRGEEIPGGICDE